MAATARWQAVCGLGVAVDFGVGLARDDEVAGQAALAPAKGVVDQATSSG